jgi:hypothetical protein
MQSRILLGLQGSKSNRIKYCADKALARATTRDFWCKYLDATGVLKVSCHMERQVYEDMISLIGPQTKYVYLDWVVQVYKTLAWIPSAHFVSFLE